MAMVSGGNTGSEPLIGSRVIRYQHLTDRFGLQMGHRIRCRVSSHQTWTESDPSWAQRKLDYKSTSIHKLKVEQTLKSAWDRKKNKIFTKLQ